MFHNLAAELLRANLGSCCSPGGLRVLGSDPQGTSHKEKPDMIPWSPPPLKAWVFVRAGKLRRSVQVTDREEVPQGPHFRRAVPTCTPLLWCRRGRRTEETQLVPQGPRGRALPALPDAGNAEDPALAPLVSARPWCSRRQASLLLVRVRSPWRCLEKQPFPCLARRVPGSHVQHSQGQRYPSTAPVSRTATSGQRCSSRRSRGLGPRTSGAPCSRVSMGHFSLGEGNVPFGGREARCQTVLPVAWAPSPSAFLRLPGVPCEGSRAYSLPLPVTGMDP